MDVSEGPLNVAVVVVTYNRARLLGNLIQSLLAMDRLPAHILIVDNASTDDTQQVIASAQALFAPGRLVNLRQVDNIGGAGGFSAGVEAALGYDAEWLWLIDDDVEVIDNGLERLMEWGGYFDCIHGQRLDAGGGSVRSILV